MAEFQAVVIAFASFVQALWDLGVTHWRDIAQLITIWTYIKPMLPSLRTLEVDTRKGTLIYQRR